MSGKLRSENLRVISSDQSPDSPQNTTVGAPDLSNIAIEVRGATLRYPVGPFVRGSLKANLFRLFGHRESTPAVAYVNAMTNLDLSIKHGERVALIGSNGSGKSTLLRALVGVYPLAEGSITAIGQIGTLLDIGLGFETESTGRENIYYRGMAMGYSATEIAAVEHQIIDFAGLGDFIDLPMRTYSSGMFVRLGFSVSTQFSPDILLIDEVFGAGDAAFAEQAVQRMMHFVQKAGIVVMATHDLALVHRFATRVLWLNRGQVVRDGPADVVVPQFHQFMAGTLSL